MPVRTKILIVAGAVVALVLGILGVGLATSGDEDAPLTGANPDRAVAAALEHTGGGEVVETEIGDDGAAYGVEIRRVDGSIVEIELDEDFRVIGSAGDDDGTSEGTDHD